MPDATAVVVVIGGLLVTPFARVGQVRIDDVLNDAPNTAALTVVASPRIGPAETGTFQLDAFQADAFQTADNPGPVITPPPIVEGMPIAIYLGAVDPAYQIFGGFIATREQTHEFDVPKNVRYDLTCIDWTRRLNARVVQKNYAAASATAIVLDVVATFAPTITVAHVAAGLPTIDGGMTFTYESVSGALSRLASKIGAYWYVDDRGDLHFWTGTEPGTEPAPIVPGADFAHLKIAVDLSQVRTRLLVEGDGGSILFPLPSGDSILPLDSAAAFNDAGGQATRTPATRLTYTGRHVGGKKANTVGVGTGGTPPPAAPGPPSVALASAATPGGLSGGPYTYAYTVEAADGGRSDRGTPSTPITITPAANPPPTNAAFPGTPTAGPIRAGVTATYATSFVDANGNETIATTGGNVLTGRSIAAPASAPGGLGWGAGGIDVGYRAYTATFVTAAGETLAGPLWVDVGTSPGNQAIMINGVPDSTDARVLVRKVYRSTTTPAPSGGGALPWRFVFSIARGATPAYVDVSSDAGLGSAALPIVSTADAGEAAIVTVPTSADARIVGRRLYRKDGGGDYRLIADMRDNTTTTYTDTLPGAGGQLAPTINRVTTGAVNVTIPVGPGGTARRRVFRTAAGGGEYRELTTINDNTTTAIVDTTPDANLGGSPLPVQGGGASSAPPPTAIGATSVRVSTLAGFPSAGWAVTESAMYFRYASTSGDASSGYFLQGVPASGQGSITAEILSGTVINTCPELIGVAPVGPTGQGDTVQLLVQVDDVPAQTALAALDGSDGVVEHYVQDRRLSEAGARARGLADLALFKNPETKVTYTTHDPNARSGRTVHVELPAPVSLVGDFLIQKATIADVSIAKNWYPKRSVDASTTRFSFDDVLARILIDQR